MEDSTSSFFFFYLNYWECSYTCGGSVVIWSVFTSNCKSKQPRPAVIFLCVWMKTTVALSSYMCLCVCVCVCVCVCARAWGITGKSLLTAERICDELSLCYLDRLCPSQIYYISMKVYFTVETCVKTKQYTKSRLTFEIKKRKHVCWIVDSVKCCHIGSLWVK